MHQRDIIYFALAEWNVMSGFWTWLIVALSKTDRFKNSTLLLWCLIITSRNYITILWPNNFWLDNHNKRETKTDHPNKEVRTPIAKAIWWKTLSIPSKGTEIRSIFDQLLYIPGILKQFDAIFCKNPSLNCIVCEWCQRRKPKHSPSAARVKLVRAVTQFQSDSISLIKFLAFGGPGHARAWLHFVLFGIRRPQ